MRWGDADTCCLFCLCRLLFCWAMSFYVESIACFNQFNVMKRRVFHLGMRDIILASPKLMGTSVEQPIFVSFFAMSVTDLSSLSTQLIDHPRSRFNTRFFLCKAVEFDNKKVWFPIFRNIISFMVYLHTSTASHILPISTSQTTPSAAPSSVESQPPIAIP